MLIIGIILFGMIAGAGAQLVLQRGTGINWPLAFVTGITVLAALVAGLVPALRASRGDVLPLLNDEGRGTTSLKIGRLSRGLVVGEMALSFALLVRVSGDVPLCSLMLMLAALSAVRASLQSVGPGGAPHEPPGRRAPLEVIPATR